MTAESSFESFGNFDEVSLAKLDIYARYLQEWLRACLAPRARVTEARIFDLCCGGGFASDGSEGGPLRTVKVLRANEPRISKRPDLRLRLAFNDPDPRLVRQLAGRLGALLHSDYGRMLAQIEYDSEPLAEYLESLLPELRSARSANLLFIDQFGENDFDETHLSRLRTLRTTDLLIFVSSDWLRRFTESETAEFWPIARDDIESVNYNHIHRFMTSYFRSLIGKEHLVAPFTFKRGTDVSGLIFASCNPWRLDKFLKTAWRRDPFSDETNFDLWHEDASRMQLALLDAQKVFDFQKELMACLESGKFDNDRDIYLYVLQRGFLGRHASDTVKAYCGMHNVRFRTRAGKAANPRLSYTSFKRPRPMVVN